MKQPSHQSKLLLSRLLQVPHIISDALAAAGAIGGTVTLCIQVRRLGGTVVVTPKANRLSHMPSMIGWGWNLHYLGCPPLSQFSSVKAGGCRGLLLEFVWKRG